MWLVSGRPEEIFVYSISYNGHHLAKIHYGSAFHIIICAKWLVAEG